jgi:hypothetical protein
MEYREGQAASPTPAQRALHNVALSLFLNFGIQARGISHFCSRFTPVSDGVLYYLTSYKTLTLKLNIAAANKLQLKGHQSGREQVLGPERDE